MSSVPVALVPVARRRHSTTLVVGVLVLALGLTSLLTAPEPPVPQPGWRWATIALGLLMSTLNVAAAVAAFRRVGPMSLHGFFQLWMLFAFSFPALEMTYRYEQLSFGYWWIPTDSPILFQAALLLALFQVVFFLALGRRVDARVMAMVEASGSMAPRRRVGVVFLLLLVPLLAARLVVLRDLGVTGVATSMITRTDYFSQLDSGVSPVVWALNTAFPVYAVVLACLAVTFLVSHPTPLGRRLFVAVLVTCVGGVALSGGRAEIVFVALTVAVSMYVAGYTTARQFAPLMVLGLCVAALLFGLSQARHGETNVLSRAADDAYVGNDYSGGDVTQVLGLGRFDAVVMILDRHDRSQDLQGESYLGALVGGLDTTFLARIAAGVDLPSPNLSGDVLGPWLFGSQLASALPSAPGEAYLNFGYAGVLSTALALGLLTRGLVGAAGRVPGPQAIVLVLVVWTMARLLSDEASLIASFVVRNWPVLIVTVLVSQYLFAQRNRSQSVLVVRQ